MEQVVAILCSGQGNQHREMFDLVKDVEEARPVFAAASEQLGRDIRSFVREAELGELYSDRNGQLLCCTQALAFWAALKPVQPKKAVIAGYSVGELAAWGCAGALDAPATLRLARQRSAAMDAATPEGSGLAAIVGLLESELALIARNHGAYIAIVNAIDSFVIGGLGEALEASCKEAAAKGATRTVRLHVAVPSHTPLLQEAVQPFRAALRAAAPQAPPYGYRLLSGIDGETVWEPEAGCDKLANQICTTIHWAACLESCRAAGAVLALELGPGAALSHMAASFFPEGRSRSVEDFRTLDGLRGWLARR